MPLCGKCFHLKWPITRKEEKPKGKPKTLTLSKGQKKRKGGENPRRRPKRNQVKHL
jgi:hypothetical protein